MNYTKTLREYCKSTPWRIFDVSYEMEEHFRMVPYKTLLKVLNRLEEEGVVETFSKGIYLIKTGEPVIDPIVEHYGSDTRGVVVGYSMYNRYEVTDFSTNPKVIYTNMMRTDTKNIGEKYVLKRLPIYFTDRIKRMICALEIIEDGPGIIDSDLCSRNEGVRKLLANYYDDSTLREVVKVHQYKYSTIVTLHSILSNAGIKNDAIKTYERLFLDEKALLFPKR